MSLPSDILVTQDEVEGIPLRVRLVADDDFSGLEGAVKDWAARQGFKAGTNQICHIPQALVESAGADIFVGTGKKLDPVWGIAALAEQGAGAVYSLESADGIEQLALGWLLAHYRFDRYKGSASEKPVSQLVVPDGIDTKGIIVIAEATALVRDLVNTPAEDMGPSQLEAATETLAAEFEASVSVLRGDVLKDAVFPAIHAVGRAASSDRAPRLIDLRWSGREDGPSLTLVGKGVCFDTGGLNLKTGNFMRNMKKDMGGAAHVLGLAQAIMRLGLPINLRVLIPAVENSVAGNAFRPGDILDTRAGLTVEIENTDAEGRLILCDALAYACEDKPDLLIDFATLTGAARIALGPEIPPVMTDDDVLWRGLEQASNEANDSLARLPLYDSYMSYLDSKVADMRNCADTGFAGSIVAGLYLKRFVKPEVPWAHFDVFAWNLSSRPGRSAGGEAQGLRASLAYIRAWAPALLDE